MFYHTTPLHGAGCPHRPSPLLWVVRHLGVCAPRLGPTAGSALSLPGPQTVGAKGLRQELGTSLPQRITLEREGRTRLDLLSFPISLTGFCSKCASATGEGAEPRARAGTAFSHCSVPYPGGSRLKGGPTKKYVYPEAINVTLSEKSVLNPMAYVLRKERQKERPETQRGGSHEDKQKWARRDRVTCGHRERPGAGRGKGGSCPGGPEWSAVPHKPGFWAPGLQQQGDTFLLL